VSARGSRSGDGACALASVSKVTQFLPMEVGVFLPMEVGRVFNVAFDIGEIRSWDVGFPWVQLLCLRVVRGVVTVFAHLLLLVRCRCSYICIA
jgi:hypothetical protein